MDLEEARVSLGFYANLLDFALQPVQTGGYPRGKKEKNAGPFDQGNWSNRSSDGRAETLTTGSPRSWHPNR